MNDPGHEPQATPQDALSRPLAPEAEPPPTQPAAGISSPAPTGRQEVQYLPRPSGPNWALVLTGLVFVVVAGGVMATQVSGFRASQLVDTGPGVLVGVGLLSAVIGAVGMIGRRRH